MRSILIAAPAFLLAACQPYGSASEPNSASEAEIVKEGPSWEIEDIAFAQAACGGCHAVEDPGLSPNPESPTFAEIARRRGVTQATLATYLRDAHNYPEAMDFELTQQQADALAAYMMTLR